MAYQYIGDRGPWNREKLWDEKEATNAKYVIPPVANIGDGPSGLTFNPGSGLSGRYNGHFFMSDFRGGAAASVVHDISLDPKGAWYQLKERADFVKGILTSDVEFGPDGALYVLDWVGELEWRRKRPHLQSLSIKRRPTAAAGDEKGPRGGRHSRTDEELVKLLARPDHACGYSAFALAAAGCDPALARVRAIEPACALARSGDSARSGEAGERDGRARLLPTRMRKSKTKRQSARRPAGGGSG
jgi:quinoprotein glucose dehydrogenase